MARVAVVTGGTRGIGEAVSKALKAAGYQVAANYGGNDEMNARVERQMGEGGRQIRIPNSEFRIF